MKPSKFMLLGLVFRSHLVPLKVDKPIKWREMLSDLWITLIS